MDPFSSPSNHLMVAKAGREDLALQHLILGVNGHALVIVTNMVNMVRLAIIVDKDGLNKPSGKSILSISSKNFCCRTLLIASFPMFRGVEDYL